MASFSESFPPPADRGINVRRAPGVAGQGTDAVRLANPLCESAVCGRFVQARVALFGKVMFLFAITYLSVATVKAVAGAEPFWRPGRESHLLATAFALAVWLIARRARAMTPRAVKLLDAAGTLGMSVSLVAMGHRYSELAPWGIFAGLISVFHVVVARAVLVPSTPVRTFAITSLSFAGLVASQAWLLAPDAAGSGGSRFIALLMPIATSATATALATVASKVVYGLHRDVRNARELGQYVLLEKIGQGGMGEVYRARHNMLRRPTAIKLLSSGVSERELRRFEKEVQLTAELSHPNTISIYDYGRTPDGTFYYAMELLDGLTLQELVERDGAQAPARVIHILTQVCAALREAHGAGLIHRDIKPENIFLCRQGGLPDVVKVLDFGLVKRLAGDVNTSQTGTDVMVGTPLYMSPEAIAAPDAVGVCSDLYALGAVAYYLLTGTPVFDGDSMVEVCGHHLHTKPIPPSQRTSAYVPADLERIVLACLEKDPGLRPASPLDLQRRLVECAEAGSWTEADAEAAWSPRPPPSGHAWSGERTLRDVITISDGAAVAR
jgi:eukaryotic-like serine/threonine-protein kinase